MVLIIVLCMMVCLVAVVLSFAEGMKMEYRASVNTVEGIEADQAVDGARRYLSYVLANSATPGVMPTPDSSTVHASSEFAASTTGATFKGEAAPLGDASFWVIGRADQTLTDAATPAFGLVDEASKLNLNTATLEMLELLPNMTPEFAAAILDWRTSSTNDPTSGGGIDVYSANKPPYQCKHAPFETVEELRLVNGATWDLLYGSDSNMNGIIDPDERAKQGNGTLSRGILDCVTVYSRLPNRRANGQPRIDVRIPIQANSGLSQLFERTCGAARASQIEAALRNGPLIQNVLQLYIVGGINPQEAAQLEDALTADSGQFATGKVNVNTALREVLICLPGIGDKFADALIAARQGKAPSELTTVAWVTEVLDNASAVQAGAYITARSYQYGADIVAVGAGGHAFRRCWMIFDTSGTAPVVRYRCDHTYWGWPLGTEIRADLDGQTASLGNALR